MDTSTQRMLERARARRQKLDEQLKSSGQETNRKRNPLQENNQPQFVKVTTEVEVVLNSQDSVKEMCVSPTKIEMSNMGQKENSTESLKVCQTNRVIDDPESNKERNIRSQLKRLGALYSDSQISSPIHKTESNFTVEDEVIKSKKPSACVARFAALANNIKQWEDDLSHPSRGYNFQDYADTNSSENSITARTECPSQSECNKKTDLRKKSSENEKGKESMHVQPVLKDSHVEHSSKNKINKREATKKIVWDEKVLQILEAQGFSRSCSHSRLVYDYHKHSSQDGSKDTSSCKPETPGDASHKVIAATSSKHNNEEAVKYNGVCSKKSAGNSTGIMRTVSPNKYEMNETAIMSAGNSSKPVESPNVVISMRSPNKGLGGQDGGKVAPLKPNISPRKIPDSPKEGSVLHKASIFESYSPNKKTKDPAELSVSERMALFERNKGQALIPKAAFSMPVPKKYLESSDKKSQLASSPDKGNLPGKQNLKISVNVDLPSKGTQMESSSGESNTEAKVSSKVLSCRNIFEKESNCETSDKSSVQQSDRQRDLDMLRNRWNKNKSLSSELQTRNTNKSKEMAVPVPPPLPQENSVSPMKSSFSALPQVTHMIPKLLPNKEQFCEKNSQSQSRMEVLHERPRHLADYSNLCKVKKVRVSPPKPGKLYPCLSDIEATSTEAESEVPETEKDSASESSMVTDSDAGNSSFGREILEAAGIRNSFGVQHQVNRMDSSDSDLSQSAISADIDGCINEALAGYDSSSESEQEEPTPPKRSRDSHSPPKGKRNTKQSPNSKPSQSFRYTAGKPVGGSSPLKSPMKSPMKSPTKERDESIPVQVVDGNQEMPLMHSVSFYRRQQNMAVKNTQVRQIVRPPESIIEKKTNLSSDNEETLVRKKITDLLDEVSKQQTVISQASQALNLCSATVEFSGSAEQVEGERLLLLATHKRHAALHEIQRLKVEGTLKPVSDGSGASSVDRGSLLITNIALSLKRDYICKLSSEDTTFHFVCLVKSQEQVLVTQVLAATTQNLQENCYLVWNSPLRLVGLYSDFKVTLEVYGLQTRREILPHNVKYHIGNKKEAGKSWLTPKKQKHESRLIMPTIHSPAGPSAVRSPEFRMAGYVVFSLRELSRTHFTLNKVSYNSPLEGNIQLKIKSEMSVDICERGFLTMFEDVSGFGAWHRRWFVLKGSVLAYWKYPDDERKVPIGQIDLNSCTTEQVGLVSRDICARPNTFLLETTRPTQADDCESLVLVRCRDRTVIRNLLSADTKEERLLWCCQLNKALTMLRAWGKQKE